MASRFQFSIRFLLVATVAVAVGAAAVRAEPSNQTTLAVDSLTVLFLTGAIVGVAQTRDRLRIFWIGASIALGLATVLAAYSLYMILLYEFYEGSGIPMPHPRVAKVAAVWCAAPVNGLFAAFLHWLFSRGKDNVRLSRIAIATVLFVSLAGAFLLGMWFGESREIDRRLLADQEDQAMYDETEDEEATLDE